MLGNFMDRRMLNDFSYWTRFSKNYESHSFTAFRRHQFDILHLPEATEVFLDFRVLKLLWDASNEQLLLFVILDLFSSRIFGCSFFELNFLSEQNVCLFKHLLGNDRVCICDESKSSEFFYFGVKKTQFWIKSKNKNLSRFLWYFLNIYW